MNGRTHVWTFDLDNNQSKFVSAVTVQFKAIHAAFECMVFNE